MAKRAVSRKKSVMQDVHPDVADKIEIFTDPERIEKARARIVDYAKVAEQFADTAVLPDEDDEDDIFAQPNTQAVVVPVVVPVASGLNDEDSDLLADLEGFEDEDKNEITPVSSSADEEAEPDYDNFGDLDDFLKDEPKPVATPVAQDEQDDPFADTDFPDFDSDILNDADSAKTVSGDEAFHDTTTDSDDMDADIFGIPSTSSEPTPYGDRPARAAAPVDQEEDLLAGLNFGDDDVSADADDAFERESKPQGRALPAWMEEGDDDIPDVFDSQRPAAETDQDEEGLFDDLNETRPAQETRSSAPPSSAALADVMGIPEDEKADETAAVVVAPLVAERPETEEAPKKKGLRGMFSRNKKVEKTVVEETASGDEIETTTVSETIETPDGVEKHESEVVVTTKKKKSKLPLAVSTLALLAALGAGFFVLDPLGVFQQPQPVVVQSSEERPPLLGETAPAVDGTPAVVAPSIVPPIPGDAPQDVEVQDSLDALDVPDVPPVSEVDPTLPDTPIAPVVDDLTPEGPGPVDLTPEGPGGEDLSLTTETPTDLPVAVDPLEAEIPSSDLDVVETDPAVVDPVEDAPDAAAQPDVFSDLYGAGVSETEAERADAAQTMARVVQLSDVLETQKTEIESALNRVKTLEAILTERDALLAVAQGEAETARVLAQEAKDMAMAQNKVLIEVVGIQDKMKIAEDLIVDLSKRTASIEADDSQASQIRQLNERITEVTRDVGLLARTVLTNGQNLADRDAAQRAADRAYEEAQAAVDTNAQNTMDRQTQAAPSGSGSVYGNEQRLMSTPSQQESTEIPSTVKIGDDIPVYGEVLDIVENQDGSRLVVMENSSKIIPRGQ